MKTNTLTLLLQIAAILHLGLLSAGFMMPGVVDLRAHLALLPMFIRRLFWVYYSFIGLCLVSFGCLTFALARTLARREHFGERAVRLFRRVLDAAADSSDVHLRPEPVSDQRL